MFCAPALPALGKSYDESIGAPAAALRAALVRAERDRFALGGFASEQRE
ncbi:hypothetical protein GCM10009021_11330 [Halarchaeum nitratireducens]|uniref:Uncharacterized protein n=1 Tax=Halarchaeum nitratireducens TaxID=489913 RepID=A0A830GAF7_9EURY|nr:hypothetical protein GCM10009021_11330 [Halarchaeum nitratireducens]